MKKALLLCLPAVVLATSCVNSLTDYNVDPKSPATVSSGSLVTGAELGLARLMVDPSVNVNPFRFYVQYWAETQYPDETNYDIATRQINRTFWRDLYLGGGTTLPTYTPGVLSNLKAATAAIQADNAIDANTKANQLACVEVMAVYGWTILVDTYGNVPYKQALDFNQGQPAYDDAAGIYTDLFARLNAAIASMKPASPGLNGTADVLYRGSMINWIKFANSLKLRMAIVTADADAARSKTQAEQAAPQVFKSNAEEAAFPFAGSPPNTNPLWESLVQSGRKDFVGTDTFIDVLSGLNDPRLPKYFQPAIASGTYTGGVYGDANDYTTASNAGALLLDPTLPGELESYAEVEFLLAEAAARGFNVGGTVTSHYDAAITASIQNWGGSTADAATYLAQPEVAYATAAGSSYKTKIGNQAWIALYNQPVQSWTTWRRLDTPKLTPGADALSAIPLRFPYPFDEQNINATNYAAASTAIGGDKVTTKIFWDKF